eukprot:CAMPEP_0197526314 /NCGR_PEP_ID=MMETSP1318-20131121/17289_1 /TAXON_ID=552666 /ORGANISM="Partenskyella glossopodia, Strain RCC365" /LENGTH=147 /DNA_ID=CAMNT_0043080419 /DNA_START=62 /DNA_END=505 /DNA_ORIENTATION=+
MSFGYYLFAVNSGFSITMGIRLLTTPVSSTKLSLAGDFAFGIVGAAFIQMGTLTLALRNRSSMNVGKLVGAVLGIYHILDASVCLWAFRCSIDKNGKKSVVQALMKPSSLKTLSKAFAFGFVVHASLAGAFVAFVKRHSGHIDYFLK